MDLQRFGTVGLLVAGLAAAACGGASGPAEGLRAEEQVADDEDRIPVRVAPVRREPMSSVYSTSSTLRADRRATVIARTQGVVRRLEVEEGDRVDRGQIVAVLEDDEQRIEAERSHGILEIESREFERARQLYDEGLLSEEAFEAARRELAEARHAAAQADLELRRTHIRAPFAGTIVKRHLDVGATVSDGTPVYDLADLDPLYTDANIPERHVATLAPGQQVRLRADASGEAVAARIERIAPTVDPATGTVKVTLAVTDAPASGLRPGAFVRVGIVTETHPEALVVPRAALVAEGRRWHLYRMSSEGDTVEEIDVTLGFEEGDRVEVEATGRLERPLRPGDRVVAVGASALSDGASVLVVEDGEETGAGDEGAPA